MKINPAILFFFAINLVVNGASGQTWGTTAVEHLRSPETPKFNVLNYTWNDGAGGPISPVLQYDSTGAPSGVILGDAQDAISKAVTLYNGATTIDRLNFIHSTTLETNIGSTSTNVVYWDKSDTYGGNAAAHVTHGILNGINSAGLGNDKNLDCDIAFNEDDPWWMTDSAPPPSRAYGTHGYDFVETLIHELGHCIGLQHVGQTFNSIMIGAYGNRSSTIRGIYDGERAGMFFQHPNLTLTGNLPAYPLAFTQETSNTPTISVSLTVRDRFDHEHGSLSIPAGAYLAITGDYRLVEIHGEYSGNPKIVGDGEINVNAGGSLTVGGTGLIDAISRININNGGTVRVDSLGKIYDTEIVVKAGGTLEIIRGEIDDGRLIVQNGGTFLAEGGTIVRKDIDVSNGGVFKTDGDPTFRFGPYDSIFSYGKVEVDGGTFEATGSSWPYFYIYNSGADDSYIINATIDDARIHINGADDVTISNVTVSNAAYAGVKAESSQGLEIKNSTFQDGLLDGAYIDASDAVILDSRFEDNDHWGVGVRGNSTADFGLQDNDHPSVIKGNDIGINVYGSSFATLGDETINSSGFSKSSVYNNTTYDAKITSATLIAEETWWGSDPPNLSKFLDYGTFIYADWLSSPVVTRMDAPDDVVEFDTLSISMRYVGSPGTGSANVFTGTMDVETTSLNALSRTEMVRHLRKLWSQDEDAAMLLVNSLRQNQSSEHQRLADLFYLQYQASEGNLVSATAIGSDLLEKPDLSADDKDFVYRRLYHLNLYSGEVDEAERLLASLVNLATEDSETESLVEEFQTKVGRAPVLQTTSVEADRESFEIASASAVANYPNPFNPTTEIRFTLAEGTDVTLTVYDVTGRIVAELFNGSLGAGDQRITWDASGFPSGTYLYRLVAGDHVQTKSMILMK